ncbi:Myb-like DNA-binding domain-containing protein 1 [Elsinoe fawcettii]|nr:Myb-like DNA-binding domain-containing protein 1 [Elsinoe fawcettii]
MGITSSQPVGAEEFQPQSSQTEAATAPQALENPAEKLTKSALEDASTFTPPPTGAEVGEALDSVDSHPSVDASRVSSREDQSRNLELGTIDTKARELDDLADLDDKVLEAVQHPLINLSPLPQLDGTTDTASLEFGDMAEKLAVSVQSAQGQTPEAAKLERIRQRAEKRARKESRRMQRALGSTPSQAGLTSQPGLDTPFATQHTVVPETQPNHEVEAMEVKAQPEEQLDEPTPHYGEEANLSYDFDDPGTQLRMEAERARAQIAASQSLSSPLQKKEQQLASKQKSKSKKRKAEAVEVPDEQVEIPAKEPKAKKRNKRASDGSDDELDQPKPKRAKSEANAKKSRRDRVKEVKETRKPLGDDELDIARSPESSPSRAGSSPKPIRSLTTDPPSGGNQFMRPKKKRRGQKSSSGDTSRARQSVSESTRSGPFTAAEVAKIEETVVEYCESNGKSEAEFKEMIRPDSSDKSGGAEVFSLLVDTLGGRSRKSIRQFCRRKYSTAHRGPWTPEEDADLKEAYEEKPGNWVHIAQLLGRLAEDCRDRWRDYVGNPARNDGIWTAEEESELEHAVAKCIARMRENRLKLGQGDAEDVDLEANVNWQVVSDMIGKSRSRIQCRYKWSKLRGRKIRISQTGTPNPRRSRKSDATTPGDGHVSGGFTAINSSAPAAAKKPKKARASKDTTTTLGGSHKLKKPRKSSGAHSSKKYKSTERVTEEDDEIEDDPQTQQDNDPPEIYDIPHSPPTAVGRSRASRRPNLNGVTQNPITTNRDNLEPEHAEDLSEHDGDDGPPDALPLNAQLNAIAPRASYSLASSPPILAPAVNGTHAQPAGSVAQSSHGPRDLANVRAHGAISRRPPSPVTSGPSRARPRTPPDEKVWLPGDQYLMLHHLMAAYQTGDFHDIGSYMDAIRRTCSEEHYTAEDRITQYWNIVKEAGFRGGLRRNIVSCIDWLADRHPTHVLARTSHGDVVYSTSLQRAPVQATPPQSENLAMQQRFNEHMQQQAQLVRDEAGYLDNSSIDPDEELSFRDQVIDRQCEINRGRRRSTDPDIEQTNLRHMLFRRRQEAREARRAAREVDLTPTEIAAIYVEDEVDSEWLPWQIEAIGRKRATRKAQEGADAAHPDVQREWDSMGAEERKYHWLKWRHKVDGDAHLWSDDMLWEVAREMVRMEQRSLLLERAKERTERLGRQTTSTVEKRRARTPEAQTREKRRRVDRWSQEVLDTMRNGEMQELESDGVVHEEVEGDHGSPADQLEEVDQQHPVLNDVPIDENEPIVNDDQDAVVNPPAEVQSISEQDNEGSDDDDANTSAGASSDADENEAHGNRSEASVELGSTRQASPELGDAVPEPVNNSQDTQDTWQSSLPSEFKSSAKPPLTSSGKKQMTYSRADKRKSGMLPSSTMRRSLGYQHDGANDDSEVDESAAEEEAAA